MYSPAIRCTLLKLGSGWGGHSFSGASACWPLPLSSGLWSILSLCRVRNTPWKGYSGRPTFSTRIGHAVGCNGPIEKIPDCLGAVGPVALYDRLVPRRSDDLMHPERPL